MSIGSWRALLKLSAKPLVNSVYLSTGPQVQQSVSRSVYAVVALSIFLSLTNINVAEARIIKSGVFLLPIGEESFFDWKFARGFWTKLSTREELETEWKKVENDWNNREFNLSLLYSNNDDKRQINRLKKFMDENPSKYPEAKKSNIKRAYDMQLAFDVWTFFVYEKWFYSYESLKTNVSFDQYRAEATEPLEACKLLVNCGPRPDWRDKDDLKKEQAMMAKIKEDTAKRK